MQPLFLVEELVLYICTCWWHDGTKQYCNVAICPRNYWVLARWHHPICSNLSMLTQQMKQFKGKPLVPHDVEYLGQHPSHEMHPEPVTQLYISLITSI